MNCNKLYRYANESSEVFLWGKIKKELKKRYCSDRPYLPYFSSESFHQ